MGRRQEVAAWDGGFCGGSAGSVGLSGFCVAQRVTWVGVSRIVSRGLRRVAAGACERVVTTSRAGPGLLASPKLGSAAAVTRWAEAGARQEDGGRAGVGLPDRATMGATITRSASACAKARHVAFCRCTGTT